jgi:hypothetical protein
VSIVKEGESILSTRDLCIYSVGKKRCVGPAMTVFYRKLFNGYRSILVLYMKSVEN